MPASTSTGADESCQVTVSDNEVTDTEPFTYLSNITPQVSSASPLRGGTGGGVTLTITGTNFP